MNEIAKSDSNLPATVLAMKGLANSVAAIAAGSGGGEQFMKMTKFGEFVFGAEELEVEPDSEWAVNPTQFGHGWICWGTKAHGTDGECLGEVMAPAKGPMPDEESLPVAKGEWTKQVSISLRCLTGEDEGIQAIFKTNSLGGKKAYTALVSAVVDEVNAGSEFVCPVVKLASSHYTHKKYGKIFTPEFKVVNWISMEGLAEGAAQAAKDPEPEPEPKRTRASRKAAAEPEPEVAEKEAEAPARRRRRRA